MTRVITTGVGTIEVKEPPYRFSVVDVGGQRNERKKWLHCFDDVKAVVFFISLAGYNQVQIAVGRFPFSCPSRSGLTSQRGTGLESGGLENARRALLSMGCISPELDGNGTILFRSGPGALTVFTPKPSAHSRVSSFVEAQVLRRPVRLFR